MKATDILYEEHRIITRVLECLEKITEHAERDGKLDAESAKSAVTFFREFADGCHHAKEEDRLFIVMQEQGIPGEGGPIGVMLTEHDHGRRFVRGMSAAIEQAAAGDEDAIREFGQNARDFIGLLSAHIYKEDNVLFPMATNVLDKPQAEQLLTDFKTIESEAGGRRHAHYVAMAKELCAAHGIDFLDDGAIATIQKELGAAQK